MISLHNKAMTDVLLSREKEGISWFALSFMNHDADYI
jgi:hypothetical protein